MKCVAIMRFVVTVALSFSLQEVRAQVSARIDTGELKGVRAEGVVSFKGIPFAAPPTGPLRWRSPQPAAKWAGVRSAAEYGNDCMQLKAPTAKAHYRAAFSEDCLFVNVWAPSQPTGKKLPVMVWIYGGGFVSGGISADIYDGTEFAKKGVILVSMNYRLGRFGFFAHRALTKEDPNGLLGNYGYMDQMAALQWVQRNIAAFGGDAKNVTLFGESAGGFAVNSMLASPLTHGLFQKAIIESGNGRKVMSGVSLHDATAGKPSGEDSGRAFAHSKGIEGEDAAALTKLRALPAEEILGGLNYDGVTNAELAFTGPMIDGKMITKDPQDIYRAGLQPRIPVIVGANSEEVGITVQLPQKARTEDELFQSFGDHASAARQAYVTSPGESFTSVSNRVLSDSFFVEPARFVARTFANAGQPVWEFRFSYVAESMRKEWTGAPHNTELWYVFQTLPARYGSATTPADERMARSIQSYWVQFAKTGDPNQPGLPNWPRYDDKRDLLMNFTNTAPVAEPDHWKGRLDLIEAIQ